MKNKDFIISCVVIIVLTLNVDVSESQKTKDPKSYKKFDYDDEPETTPNANSAQLKKVNQMKQLKRIELAPLVTHGPFTFEGVDYHDMPNNFYRTYHDCYYDHLTCIRYHPYLHTVCAYHLWYGWQDITNQCQIDLINCLHRMQFFSGFYGNSFKNDLLYYNGDGIGCYDTLRNGKSSNPDAVVSFMRQRGAGNAGVKGNYVRNDAIKNRKFYFIEVTDEAK